VGWVNYFGAADMKANSQSIGSEKTDSDMFLEAMEENWEQA